MIVRTLLVCAAIAGASLSSGCASTAGEKDAEAYQPKVYRTGSNIPLRDPDDKSQVQTVNPDDIRMRSPGGRPGG